MIFPSVDRLADKVESRYTLVVLAAKRAKQLREGAPKLIETSSTNPLTIALQEIAAGKITFAVPNHDDVPARGMGPEIEALPRIEAEGEAAEVVAEAPTAVDEAARVAQLLQVPGAEEEAPALEETEQPEVEAASEREEPAAEEGTEQPEVEAASEREEPAAEEETEQPAVEAASEQEEPAAEEETEQPAVEAASEQEEPAAEEELAPHEEEAQAEQPEDH
jgi:DNA-directed RNA polymerase subunit omega